MRKTLLKHFTDTKASKATVMLESEDQAEMLSDLVIELKTTLELAANDLLQPRTEALTALLKRALN
ncbi:MAG: hypothetical protein JST82_12230 [Bacteroidetes bacterium]|nr:hypothetical protein [Bacteroidota bacterium]